MSHGRLRQRASRSGYLAMTHEHDGATATIARSPLPKGQTHPKVKEPG